MSAQDNPLGLFKNNQGASCAAGPLIVFTVEHGTVNRRKMVPMVQSAGLLHNLQFTTLAEQVLDQFVLKDVTAVMIAEGLLVTVVDDLQHGQCGKKILAIAFGAEVLGKVEGVFNPSVDGTVHDEAAGAAGGAGAQDR